MKKICKRFVIICVIAILTVFIGINIFCMLPQKNTSGVLLAFDDYYPDNWESNFDLFDEHDVDVTFFINSFEPTEFCAKAVERGHEIGFHSAQHVDMTTISEEEVWRQAIEPIETFREAGYELTSFAYPYGSYTEVLNEELLKHYKVVRGAWHYELKPKENLKSGLVEAVSIDNANYASELEFKLKTIKRLCELKCNDGVVVAMFSHGIENGDWCISPERLEFMFKAADKLNLEFYTFKDLQ